MTRNAWIALAAVACVIGVAVVVTSRARFVPDARPTPTATVPSAAAQATPTRINVYAAATDPHLRDTVVGIPARVYVPNSDDATVDVIEVASRKVVMHFPVGAVPHHITPSWDLRQLYVDNTGANSLTTIDPRSGMPVATVKIADPYNLYFIPDGSAAIVVAERLNRLDFYDRSTWSPLGSMPIPWAGVDHLDFSADGHALVASAEFSGAVAKVDLVGRRVTGFAHVGGQPIDVRLTPDGSVFFIANQGRHGVSVFDPDRMTEVAFIPTGRGAHGLLLSRDASRLLVSNRLAGTISVIDLSTRQVVATWAVGGSPDMMQVSPDGRELWVSNRFHASVSVIDTATGGVVDRIPVGAGPHGLTYFPQPGIFSVGHNGVYR